MTPSHRANSHTKGSLGFRSDFAFGVRKKDRFTGPVQDLSALWIACQGKIIIKLIQISAVQRNSSNGHVLDRFSARGSRSEDARTIWLRTVWYIINSPWVVTGCIGFSTKRYVCVSKKNCLKSTSRFIVAAAESHSTIYHTSSVLFHQHKTQSYHFLYHHGVRCGTVWNARRRHHHHDRRIHYVSIKHLRSHIIVHGCARNHFPCF